MNPSEKKSRCLDAQRAARRIRAAGACRITGQHRSTQRHKPRGHDRDDGLRECLRTLLREHPRWGYRRAWAHLREEGWLINHKKI